jgi:hypothetical protein
MLVAFLLAAALTDWVPARWTSNDPKSLELLSGSPINCLLIERNLWSAPFATQAAARGIAMLGVIRPEGDPLEAARQANSLHFAGVVLDGSFENGAADHIRKVLSDSHIQLVELTTRSRMHFDGASPVIGTFQGLWPGIQVDPNGETKSGPSGTPWINTNTGFLRYARAASDATVWIATTPPPNTVVNVTRYLQAIGDAAMTGARWVVSLDSDLNKRLLARDPAALAVWKQINAELKFYEDHKEWRGLRTHSQFALVEDENSGALLSGGIVDMIAVKHTPVRPIPNPKLTVPAMQGAKMAVDVDPSSLTPEQKDVLKAFTRGGGTLLTGPPGWKFQTLNKEEITLGKADLEKLDEIWKELNSLTGRQNMGARLFNVSSMLSNLLETADGKQLVLHLVNYSDFPIESITAHVLGTYHHAKLYRPDSPPVDCETYAVDEGTGVDIDKMGAVATIVLE